MKRIQHERDYTERIVSLYRDDLDHLIEILRGSSSNVLISDGDYEYDSLEELMAQKGITVNAIAIVAPRPFVALKLRRQAWLQCEASSEAETVFLKIKEVIQSKTSLLLRFRLWAWVCLIVFSTLWTAVFIFYSRVEDTVPPPLAIIILFVTLYMLSLLILALPQTNLFFSINLT